MPPRGPRPGGGGPRKPTGRPTGSGKAPRFAGSENGYAYLSDSRQAVGLFGPPAVSAGQMIDWIAAWIRRGGEILGKPTHYETQDGRF